MALFTKTINGILTGTSMVLGDLPSISAHTAIANATGSANTPTAVPMVSAATASAIMIRDTNANAQINNLIENVTTTATAAGTTTLNVSSTFTQQFTGTTTQTVVLPDATTLTAGQSFFITNRSTGVVTVNANGGGLIQTMAAGSQTLVTVISIGTSAGTWDSAYSSTTGGGGGMTNPMTTLGDIITGGSGGTPQRLGIGTPGQVLTDVSGQPAWSTPSVSSAVPPTVQKFLSGSGTYTTPSGVLYIRVRMVGGGGGSAGGAGSPTSGGAGSASTFGSSLLSAGGGGAGTAGASASGGTGGTSSLGTGPIGTAITGGSGSGGFSTGSGGTDPGGPNGGSSALGGGGAGGGPALSGGAGAANTGGGAGGGGCGSTANTTSGGGGGSGGFIDAIITTPTSTYSYTVGTGGSAGTGGTSGAVGGSGYIEVTEYYAFGSTTANNTPPTVQKFLSGSGTYVTPAGVLYVRVKMVGAGGGGSGGGDSGGTNGGTGGNTTFGTSLLTANGGGGGTFGANAGGTGGTSSLGTGPIGTAITGGTGGGGGYVAAANSIPPGGSGASSPFGGAGGGTQEAAGTAGANNTGSGGGGGSTTAINLDSGSGGGAGGYIDAVITSPSATYSYSIGTAGTAGTAGTNGTAGGAGGSGYIEVTEYYASGSSASPMLAPTIQRFLSSSGTYSTPAGVLYLKVRMVGGGGGGAGGGNGTTGGTAGGNSTFGTSLLTANGGGAGTWFAAPGAGGTATVSAPATQIVALTGGTANGGPESVGSNVIANGGTGASSPFGGAGGGGMYNSIVGSAAVANTGSGGGGGGATNVNGQLGGGGGAAGGYVEAIITNPVGNYSYSVGTAGTAGTSTGGGSNGGAGGSGYIEVTEYYASGASTSQAVPPTIQKFLSGSGTYTTPSGVLYIQVEMVGGGGGGASGQTLADGSAGTASTFGTSLLSAGGGGAGISTVRSTGGTGGSSSLGSGPIGIALTGGAGGGNEDNNFMQSQQNTAGGTGGASALGGAGSSGAGNSGTAGATNTGGGGGGGALDENGNSRSGAGGGAGGYVNAIITSPSATYAYSVGTGGTGGTGTYNGGNGGSGLIKVTEYYSSGGTTVWGGVKNYLSYYIASTSSNVPNTGNGNFELATTSGWNLAHSTLSSLIPTSAASPGNPFSATSGGSSASGNLSLSLISSGGQIAGNYSGSLVSSASSTAGDMLISNAFFIDKQDQAKVQTIKFYYNVNSGAANLNFSGTSSNSFAVWIYDVTNAAWIMPAGAYNLVQNSGTGYCTATFQTTSNSTQYQIALININASSGAYTLYADDFYVGPQTAPMAPAMSDWLAYTPTITGVGTATGISFFWKRDGGDLLVQGGFTAGTVTASLFSLTLPSVTIDSTKLPQNNTTANAGNNIGTYSGFGGGGSGSMTTATATNAALVYAGEGWQNVSGVQALTPVNGSQIFDSNDYYGFEFRVPIAGWSSNSVASSDTDTRVVAASYYVSSSTITPGTGNQINFDTKLVDTHAAVTTGASWKFTAPVSGIYSVSVVLIQSGTTAVATNIYKNGTVNLSLGICSSTGNGDPGGTAIISLNAGDFIDIRPNSGSPFNGGTLGSSTLISSISVERISGPAVVTATETVKASYYLSAGNYTPGANNPFNFDTKITDSHGAVTTGGSWKFTAPVSGFYQVTSLITWDTVATGDPFLLYVNGTSMYRATDQYGTAVGSERYVQVALSLQLNAGDFVDLRQPNATASFDGAGPPYISYIQIYRIGN